MADRILLVEDNENNAEILIRRLTRQGFEVSLAVDGLEAIERAKQDQPDLILLDMDLPELDGWQAAKRLKADPITAWIPIIAVTAYAMVEERTRSLEAGCDDFETKPVDLPRLLEKMTSLLRAGRLS
jgi:two-component system, cell cycle response regulator DivK